MNIDALIALIRDQRSMLIPFVGSGMTVPAGAPTVTALARQLAQRTGAHSGTERWPSLPAVVDEAEQLHGIEAVQTQLSEMATGWILHPTPALTTLCGTPHRTIITTNYDDGIERAARSRGIKPTPLLPTDPRILLTPPTGELHVVHLHGIASRPDTLVLPGRTTAVLEVDDVFQRFISTVFAPRGIVHLGFSFARDESHLHKILAWLQEHVATSGHHYVVLPEDEVEHSRHLDDYNMVTVVPYVSDDARTEVERVCVAFAPRAATSDEGDEVTWVHPVIFDVGASEDAERLAQRLSAFDFGTNAQDEHIPFEDLGAEGATLLIGTPGAGKTTTLRHLASTTAGPFAIGNLASFRPVTGDDVAQRAIARLLLEADGEPVAADILHGPSGCFCLDRLDEVSALDREAALAAIGAAVDAWPQHSWVVASRPTTTEAALRERGFSVRRIMPSRRWAERYLETRGVPPYRTRQAMLDGYGIGELMRIPVFAERVADRLLDEDPGVLKPLQLLTETQDEATAKEARRRSESADDLGGFLRDLALGLAIRGRSSATLAELHDVSTPLGVTGQAARERLVMASVLADEPDVAAFPHKTLQDALCAQAILDSGDPVATLRRIAMTEVGGIIRFRNDWDFLIDLVFEHASLAERSALRALDEQRWARTVITGADPGEAREALSVLWDWHAARRWPFGVTGDGGLRTALGAVQEIARRFPEVVEERRADLEWELNQDENSARRSIAALGGLPQGGSSTQWVEVALQHDGPLVVSEAAVAAMRLGVRDAVPRLRELVSHRSEHVSVAAVGALVKLLPLDELPEVARASGYDGLRPAYRLLCERLDLDTGLAVVAAAGSLTSTTAALLDHFIREVSEDAWTPARVQALMGTLTGVGGEQPDLDGVARALRQQPQTAFAAGAASVRPLQGVPYGPVAAMLALGRLLEDTAPGSDYDDLHAAIVSAQGEDRTRRARDDAPRLARERLAKEIDRDGLELDPDALNGVAQIRFLDDRHRKVLAELVDRWWPSTDIAMLDLEEGLASPEVTRARAAILLGAELHTPLPLDHWTSLLDAHLGESGWSEPIRFHDNDVTGWLARSRTTEAEDVLVKRLASAGNSDVLSHLIGIAGRGRSSPALLDAAFGRLAELDSGQRWWSNAAGLLLEDGQIDRGRRLLQMKLAAQARDHLIDRLAKAGDPEAQRDVLDQLTAAVAAGEQADRPHWWEEARSGIPVDAAARLADAALLHDNDEMAGFALGLLEQRMDPAVLPALEALAARHVAVDDVIERHACRIATLRLISAAPDSLGAAASWFAVESATAGARTPDVDQPSSS